MRNWKQAGWCTFLCAFAAIPAAFAQQADQDPGATARRGALVGNSALGAFSKRSDEAARKIDASELIRAAGTLPARSRPPGYPAADIDKTDTQSLDWREAIAIAVNRYPSITSALGTLAQQGELVNVAHAGYLPKLKGGITSGEQGEYGSGQVATLGLTQMLYDFGKTRSAVDRERAGVRREQAIVLQSIDDVIEQTAQALIEVHRYQVLRESANTRIEALRKVQEITELRAEAGAATRSDPVQARARVEAAQAHLFEIGSQLQQWRGRLMTYLGPGGLPVEVQEAPRGLLDNGGVQMGEDELRRLPQVLVAEAERAMAEADLENARAQRYPTISFEANANKRMGPAGNRYEQIYGKSTYSTAFISMNSSLYQGGALAAQSRASANALAAADAKLEAARLTATDELRTYGERIEGLKRRIGVLEERVRSITETRELYWDQYLSLGTRNVLDLLNAEQEISQSVEDLANARHDLWMAQLGWLVTAGLAREVFGLNNTRVQGVELLP